MAIRRSYKQSESDPSPDRRSLGRLEVTLDGLRVLMEMLAEHHRRDDPSVAAPEVFVEYDEGYFTDAGDMRLLSDANLRDLRVKCGETTVHLSPFRTEAIGPVTVNELIENAWARGKRTRKRPKTEYHWSPYMRFLSTMTVLAVVGLLLLQIPSTYAAAAQREVSVGGWFLAALLAATWSSVIFARPKNYAVVIPLSQNELRKQAYSRSKWPIVSALIATLALIVSVTFNLINILNHH